MKIITLRILTHLTSTPTLDYEISDKMFRRAFDCVKKNLNSKHTDDAWTIGALNGISSHTLSDFWYIGIYNLHTTEDSITALIFHHAMDDGRSLPEVAEDIFFNTPLSDFLHSGPYTIVE